MYLFLFSSIQTTVRAVLECIISAPRPLKPRELEELFLFDLDLISNGPACLSLGDDVLSESPEEALLEEKDPVNIFKLLPHFLRLGPNDEVSFIHFTVEEYLLSQPHNQLQGPAAQISNEMLAVYGTSRERAYATGLLILLSALDNKNREKLPTIGNYSDEQWFIHARSTCKLPESPLTASALAYFLQPDSSSFNNWVARRDSALFGSGNHYEKVGRDRPIHWAVRIGSQRDVKRLIDLDNLTKSMDEGTGIQNIPDTIGWTPLYWALCIRDTAMRDILIRGNETWILRCVRPKDAKSNILHLLVGPFAQSALWWTRRVPSSTHWPAGRQWFIGEGLSEAVQALLSVAPNPRDLVSAPDLDGKTPLHYLMLYKFAGNEKWDTAKLLIQHGAKSEPGVPEFITCYAAMNSDATIITTFANQYGINMGTGIALHVAVKAEAIECVQALLDLHVDPNIRDKGGKRPLDHALEYNGPWCFFEVEGQEHAARNHQPTGKQRRIYELLKQYGAELQHVLVASKPTSESRLQYE
ncbi:ankyrin [Clavulina sp. PMI_390]|nr:ankyrin [Clavulina sp. PMI_390]